ncbi:YxeA family protein [Herbaspirillum sp. RV1423]|uniref:YxeA family protein n=1 Tax=Herbaspirillum sp. RV1423 TaxID=1443993 RepID=UPI001E40EADD|nr:YxeA family protein [Herbaspirillum sp. RV1423]
MRENRTVKRLNFSAVETSIHFPELADRKMKRIYVLSLLAGVAFAASVLLSPAFNSLLNRFGKDQFYVYVIDAGKRILPGAVVKEIYEYRLPAMDESGEQKTLTFTADKQLSLDTYLRLYVSSANKVTAWEEVQQQELPNRIKNGNLP